MNSNRDLNRFERGRVIKMSVRPLVQVDSVKVWIPDREVQRVRLNGNTDILDNEEVQYFIDRGGKISSVEGNIDFRNIPFNFVVSYATESGVEMGRVMVSKKGSTPIDPEVRDDAYTLLEELFEEYFV